MKKEIWLDMDGTFVDLYGVNGWLPMLEAEKTTPYDLAKPLVNFSELEKVLKALQKKGFLINIVSWTSKNSTPNYHEKVVKAKKSYLKRHLNIKFDKIDIEYYGTNKGLNRNGFLFDDEIQNRQAWQGKANTEKDLIKKLYAILEKV